MKNQIRKLIDKGVYDQNAIFNTLYPKWDKHYSILRNMIAEVKNDPK